MRRCAIYVRVSTEKQADEGFSIPQQTERLTKYAASMEWEVVKIYTDDGYSGATLDRPGMQALMTDVSRRMIDVVLVDKLDRFSRSIVDTMRLIDELRAHSVAFVSRSESFDTSTSLGRGVIAILAAFAEMERDRIKERLADGKLGKVKSGRYLGDGGAPYGYNYSKENGLTINPYEAQVVRIIYNKYLYGQNFNQISRDLNAVNISPKRNDSFWHPNTVRRMLQTPVYVGKFTYKGETYDGSHPAIITMEAWNEVQAMIEATTKTKNAEQSAYPLTGLCRCARCGAVYAIRRSRNPKLNVYYEYYICYTHQIKAVRGIDCDNKIWKHDELLDIIYGEVRKLSSEPLASPEQRRSETASLKRQRNDLRKKISRLMELYSNGTIDAEYITEQIHPLQERIKAIERLLDELTEKHPPERKKPLKTLLESFERVLATNDGHQINKVLRQLIDHIDLDGDDISIYWNF